MSFTFQWSKHVSKSINLHIFLHRQSIYGILVILSEVVFLKIDVTTIYNKQWEIIDDHFWDIGRKKTKAEEEDYNKDVFRWFTLTF